MSLAQWNAQAVNALFYRLGHHTTTTERAKGEVKHYGFMKFITHADGKFLFLMPSLVGLDKTEN